MAAPTSSDAAAQTIAARDFLLVKDSTNLTDGENKVLLAATPCAGWARIAGLCKSNRAVTISVFQGSGIDDADMELKDSFTVAADASEGAGKGYDYLLSGADKVRIEASNPGGAATTSFNFTAKLRSH